MASVVAIAILITAYGVYGTRTDPTSSAFNLFHSLLLGLDHALSSSSLRCHSAPDVFGRFFEAFVNDQPTQFVYLMASEFAEKEVTEAVIV